VVERLLVVVDAGGTDGTMGQNQEVVARLFAVAHACSTGKMALALS